MAKKWYVIHTYSGYENKVKEALLQRIKEHNKEASFGEVLIPTETVQETRGNGLDRRAHSDHFGGLFALGSGANVPPRCDGNADRRQQL